MDEENPENDPLQSLIAEILDAEAQGQFVDREEFVRAHQEHEVSLREFFANHDSMKGGGAEDATLSPGTSPPEDATLPPQATADDVTLPPQGNQTSSRTNVGDKVRYFGDYELLEEIARGGMGVVYKARQINLNRIVALKMILSGQLASEEDVKRFYTEAEAAANLDHPGIVPIFEVGEHQGQHYFSMGYIEGQSLAQKVAEGPLPPREAAELVKKICEAMAYAHERGVIHRDLKPANILLDQIGQPRVTDFGLAKQLNVDSGLTGTGQILGTPSYMAPEQASGKAEVGPLADVYALGAILYCLLTGRPPFQAANPMDTLLQVLDREPIALRQLNSAVPKDLETICLRCLQKVSMNRYESSATVGDDLKRFIAGEPVQARPVGRLERSWRWCKRNPALASLASLAVCLLIGGSILSSYFAINESKARGIAETNEVTARIQSQRADQNALTAKENELLAIESAQKAVSQTIMAYRELGRSQLNEARSLWQASINNRRSHAIDLLSRSVNLRDESIQLIDSGKHDARMDAAELLQDWEVHTTEARSEAIRWLTNASLREVKRVEIILPNRFVGSSARLTWSPDGQLVANIVPTLTDQTHIDISVKNVSTDTSVRKITAGTTSKQMSRADLSSIDNAWIAFDQQTGDLLVMLDQRLRFMDESGHWKSQKFRVERWSVATGDLVGVTLLDVPDAVYSLGGVSFHSEHDSILAQDQSKGKGFVFSISRGTQLVELPDATAPLSYLASKKIICATVDGGLSVLDWTTGKVFQSSSILPKNAELVGIGFPKEFELAATPDGSLAAVLVEDTTGPQYVRDRDILLIDVDDLNILGSFRLQTVGEARIAFDAEGSSLLVFERERLTVLNPETGSVVIQKQFPVVRQPGIGLPMPFDIAAIPKVAGVFTETRSRKESTTVALRQFWDLDLTQSPYTTASTKSVPTRLAFADTKMIVAEANGSITLAKADNPQSVAIGWQKGHPLGTGSEDYEEIDLQLDPSEQVLVRRFAGITELWDVASCEMIERFGADAVASENAKFLAEFGSSEHPFRIFDIGQKQWVAQLAEIEDMYAFKFSTDGEFFAWQDPDDSIPRGPAYEPFKSSRSNVLKGTTLHIHESASGKQIYALQGVRGYQFIAENPKLIAQLSGTDHVEIVSVDLGLLETSRISDQKVEQTRGPYQLIPNHDGDRCVLIIRNGEAYGVYIADFDAMSLQQLPVQWSLEPNISWLSDTDFFVAQNLRESTTVIIDSNDGQKVCELNDWIGKALICPKLSQHFAVVSNGAVELRRLSDGTVVERIESAQFFSGTSFDDRFVCVQSDQDAKVFLLIDIADGRVQPFEQLLPRNISPTGKYILVSDLNTPGFELAIVERLNRSARIDLQIPTIGIRSVFRYAFGKGLPMFSRDSKLVISPNFRGSSLTTFSTDNGAKHKEIDLCPGNSLLDTQPVFGRWDENLDSERRSVLGSGSRVVALDLNGVVRLIDLESEEIVGVIPPLGHQGNAMDISVASQQGLVFSASKDGTVVLRDIDTGSFIHVVEGHYGSVMSIDVSEPEHSMVTCDQRGFIRRWEYDVNDINGKRVAATAVLWEKSLQTLSGIPPFEQTSELANDFTIQFCNDHLDVMVNGLNGELHLLDGQEGTVVRTFSVPEAKTTSFAVVPGTETVIAALDDGTLRGWNMTSGELVATWANRNGSITDLAVAPDASLILTAGDVLTLWDAQAGKQVFQIDWLSHACTAAAFSDDGTQIAWACRDKTFSTLDLSEIRKKLGSMGLEW